jgi:hypothetical protein
MSFELSVLIIGIILMLMVAFDLPGVNRHD